MKSFDSLRVPKYVQLMFHLREQIGQGELKSGDPLPTREKLMKEHGLSLSTVTRAITELERQGWLVSRQGSGTFVVKRSSEGEKTAEESKVIGLIMPINYNNIDGFIHEFINETTHRYFKTLVMFSPDDEEEELNIARTLFEKQVDAVVWYPVQPKRHISVASLFGKNKIPVIIGEKVSEPVNNSWYCVRSDYYGGTRSAVLQLLEQGHRKIAYVGPRGNESDFGSIPERWNAYKDIMKERDLWNPDTLVINPSVFKEWHVNLNRLENLFRGSDAPTAIIGYDDIIALEIMRSLKTLGKRIPEEVAIIGHGDYSSGAFSDPRLSTVSPCVSQYVDTMVNVLTQLLDISEKNESIVEKQEIVIPQRLLLRDSTISTDEMLAAS